MLHEYNVSGNSLKKGIKKGLFSIIEKDQMSKESIQESAKNAVDFIKDIEDEHRTGVIESIYIFMTFMWQGGSHLPFRPKK